MQAPAWCRVAEACQEPDLIAQPVCPSSRPTTVPVQVVAPRWLVAAISANACGLAHLADYPPCVHSHPCTRVLRQACGG